MSTAIGGAFRGLLNTATPLKIAVSINVVNFLLDPPLIATLGVSGAAAATVVAEWLGAGAFLFALQRTPLRFEGPRAPQWAQVRLFATASGAVLLRTVVLQGTLLLATATVSRGSLAGAEDPSIVVAAHQVRNPVLPLGSGTTSRQLCTTSR